MDGTLAYIEVPATPPEDAVWQLAAADMGGNAVMLAAGIAVLWRSLKRVLERVFETASKQVAASDARAEQLITRQAASIETLTTAVYEVKTAVVRSDEHNQQAINGLRSHLERHDARLDRVDVRLDVHGDRITAVEHGGVHRLPRTGNGQG